MCHGGQTVNTLQRILDALAAGDDVSAILTSEEIDAAALTTLESDALNAFDELRQTASSDEDVQSLETLVTAVEAIRGEAGRRETIAQERASQLEGLAARIAPATATDEDAPIEEPNGDPVEEPVLEGTVVEEERELVAASATQPAARPRARVDLGAVAARRAAPPAPVRDAPQLRDASGWSMIAAANVPGISVGETYSDMGELTAAAVRRLQAMPAPDEKQPARIQHGLAQIRKSFPDELTATAGGDHMALMKRATDHKRLAGGSLLAAGGWCAPSETIYDLCQLEARTGLIDVPEITANRGGIRFTPGPDFSEIFSNTGFIQTEAQAEAGTLKPCYEVPCEDFTEVRLDAIGVCISAGLLQQRAYPELVERTLEGAITAHMHRYAGQTIARMVAGSTAVALGAGLGASSHILDAVELQVMDYRTKHRMDENAVLEAVFPMWTRGLIRSDIAKQNGWADRYEVTDAQINAWFALRGVRAQFVYNFQDAYAVVPGTFGGAVPATSWPATLEFLLYSAGTWLRLTQDIIDLSTVHDSTLFRINRYNALFVEDGLAVAKKCFESRIVTVPVCPDGSSGEQRALACPTV